MKTKKKRLSEFAGILTEEEGKELEESIKDSRRRSREREKRLWR